MATIKTPTALGYAILALLQKGPLTGYGIRGVLKAATLDFYSDSPGSIYPALRRLRSLGLVSKIAEKAKGRAHFALSHQGQSALLHWLRQDIQIEEVKSQLPELLLRFVYQDDPLEQHEQLHFMEQLIGHLASVIAELEQNYAKQAAQQSLHKRLALQNNLQRYVAHYTWAKHAWSELKKH